MYIIYGFADCGLAFGSGGFVPPLNYAEYLMIQKYVALRAQRDLFPVRPPHQIAIAYVKLRLATCPLCVSQITHLLFYTSIYLRYPYSIFISLFDSLRHHFSVASQNHPKRKTIPPPSPSSTSHSVFSVYQSIKPFPRN